MADEDGGRLDLEEFRTRLLGRKGQITELTAKTRGDSNPVELDQQKVGRLSRMDALQQQAMAKATANRREIELQRIGAALRRMEEGEYGYCAACGEPIALKRLEADPTIPTCIDCARN